MQEDIKNFPGQLAFAPEIKNEAKWKKYENYILSGMGGSHLQGDILKAVMPQFPLFLHQNYGLPVRLPPNSALIAASYSGNTEEVLNSLSKATENKIPIAVVSKGGKLLEIAKKEILPYIELPQENIQPRLALGHSFRGLIRLLGLTELEEQSVKLAEILKEKQAELQRQGEDIAEFLQNKIPVVYSSERNCAVSRIWKINFNETSKIPAFYNTFPELNHNEMTGFDVSPPTKHLSEKMAFIIFSDDEDYSKNTKRAQVLQKILEEKGFPVLNLRLEGETRMEKVFSAVLLSMWTSFYLAQDYENDPENVPLVEKFKKLL